MQIWYHGIRVSYVSGRDLYPVTVIYRLFLSLPLQYATYMTIVATIHCDVPSKP